MIFVHFYSHPSSLFAHLLLQQPYLTLTKFSPHKLKRLPFLDSFNSNTLPLHPGSEQAYFYKLLLCFLVKHMCILNV
ncbi:hypothetical protein J1N35_040815, partial [Gossypium stocksii]